MTLPPHLPPKHRYDTKIVEAKNRESIRSYQNSTASKNAKMRPPSGYKQVGPYFLSNNTNLQSDPNILLNKSMGEKPKLNRRPTSAALGVNKIAIHGKSVNHLRYQGTRA